MVLKDVPLVEFMYLVFTLMPGESYNNNNNNNRVIIGDSGLCCCACVRLSSAN